MGEYQHLKRLQEQHPQKATRPPKLPLSEIKVAPKVFQARQFSGERHTQDYHVRSLIRAFKALPKGEFLDAVLVYPIGKDFYCVDGHHTLEAYRCEQVSEAFPVEYFEGNLEDAIKEAISRNTKVHLNMDQGERLEATWRLVALGAHSIREIAIASGGAERTISNMRATLKQLKEIEPKGVWETWREAKAALSSETKVDHDDTWQEALIIEWAERLGKTFGKKAGKLPTIFAQAVAEYGGDRIVRAIIELDLDAAREAIKEDDDIPF